MTALADAVPTIIETGRRQSGVLELEVLDDEVRVCVVPPGPGQSPQEVLLAHEQLDRIADWIHKLQEARSR